MARKPDLSLIGQTYNSLTVIRYTDQRNSYGRGLYLCKCLLCGGERLATRANLLRGEIKDCGCSRHLPRTRDLTGQRFGRLLVNGTTVYQGKMRYTCRCDCGNDTIVSSQNLIRGLTTSCGCLHHGEDAAIKKLYIADTAPCKLHPEKLRRTNTSGITGVFYDPMKKRWCAEITFKRKKYRLGKFIKKSDAAAVRKQAEEQMFGNFLEWYEQYKASQG